MVRLCRQYQPKKEAIPEAYEEDVIRLLKIKKGCKALAGLCDAILGEIDI